MTSESSALDMSDDFRLLMQQVAEGSEEAAWQLVEHHGEAIRRAVRRVLTPVLRSKFDSLDFVQLVWSSFFRSRDRAQRFERPEQLVAFLVQMTRNKVGMEVRRRLGTAKFNVNREQALSDVEQARQEQMADRSPAPLELAIAREQWDRLTRDQPEHYRQMIRMKLQGYTCQEISDALHLAESTVRRFLNRLCRETVE